MKKIVKTLVVVVLCLTLVLSMSACAPKKEAATGVSLKAFSENGKDYLGSVKIGTVSCEAGPYASVGVPYTGFMRLYVDYINQVKGGLGVKDGKGYKLDWKHYDEAGDGAVGAQYVQTLVEDDQVFAMCGNLGTWILVAAQDYIIESGVPSVYWGTGASAQVTEKATDNRKFTYPVQPMYGNEGRILYLRAKNMPKFEEGLTVNKIGVLHSSTDDGLASIAGIKAQAEKDNSANKPTVVYVQVNSADPNELTSQIQQVQDCDVIIASCNQTYFKGIYTAMSTNPTIWGKPVLTEYVNIAPTTVPDCGREEGASNIYGGAWVILDDTADDRQIKDFERFCEICQWGIDNGKISQTDYDGWVISAYAMSSFIALDVLQEGFKRMVDAGMDFTAENLNTAFESAPVDVSISGGLQFANGERTGLDRMSFVKWDRSVNNFVAIDPMRTMTELMQG